MLDEVWGIDPASQDKLRAMGCCTVADVRDLQPRSMRAGMMVFGERVVHELRGSPCFVLESVEPRRNGCAVACCFSGRVNDLTVEQVVGAHATRLGVKLRRERPGTTQISVFFHTSEHDTGTSKRSAATTVSLAEATSDTVAPVRAATAGVYRIFVVETPLQQGRRHHS